MNIFMFLYKTENFIKKVKKFPRNTYLSFKRKIRKTCFEKPLSKYDSYLLKQTYRHYFDGVPDSCQWKQWAPPISNFSSLELGITNMRAYSLKEKTILEISTYRPGICIGKGGSLINSCREYLRKELKFPNIEIYLVETNIWD